MLIINKPFADY